MLAWDGIDLVLALWTPLLVAWAAVAAWGVLSSRASPLESRSLQPRATRGAMVDVAGTCMPSSTSALHAMLDAADERAATYVNVLAQHPTDPMRLDRRRGALELTTLVALLMVRDWAARMDREPLGAPAIGVVDSIRTRTGEALLTLFASPGRGEAGPWRSGTVSRVQRLREHLAELGSELRLFGQAHRAAGHDPYR